MSYRLWRASYDHTFCALLCGQGCVLYRNCPLSHNLLIAQAIVYLPALSVYACNKAPPLQFIYLREGIMDFLNNYYIFACTCSLRTNYMHSELYDLFLKN